MDDMKDKLKGFMKKVNLSSSSGKFKGQGRVLGSSTSGPGGPIQSRYNPTQAPNPRPKPTPSPTSSSVVSSNSASAPLPEKTLITDQQKPGSPRYTDPDPDRKPQDGFDPYGSLITSSKRSQNGYSLNTFECPICGSSFTSEEDVSVHVENCLISGNGDNCSSVNEGSANENKSEVQNLVAVYLSSKPPESAVDVVLRLLKNIVKEPEIAKFRKIRLSNPKIKEAIGEVPGGIELLEFVGFELKEEAGEMCAVMEVPDDDRVQLVNKVVGLLEQRKVEVSKKDENSESSAPVVVAEVPAKPKNIDRQIRVFFSVPESVAARIELPDSFYSLSAEEVKREAEMRRKKMAESQLLIPKSFKEKQAKAARKRYKRTIIRVQFPDGVVLQGVFAPWEPTTALYEFVSSALKEPSLQFELLDPVLVRRRVIPHSTPHGQNPRTLEDEELVPAALIKFRPMETDSLLFTGLSNELLEISEPLGSNSA
ncbi:PREDICTED: plant UBX domain-containing protein 2 isoform X2 [Tarenaya hassleriana]|uniref:plant UBX domain-containing protein 2 isoform X1 n=1 Tax=Tarenaya hassleriana TaxID=28532 RepID=UPI00053C4B85|nr:PREDICTED: plant UBX domain-containing protein 2 isoform X1 [Tarenaya hassleriana]XP_010527800.1 PREDICTED: plant UBX domain-containing protein 2 isoform X2 [Tarenaya hassleriana]